MDEEKFLTFCLWTDSNLKDITLAKRIARIVLPWDDELPATALFGGPLTKDRNERFSGDGDRFIECLTSPQTNYVVLTNQGRRKPPILFGLTFAITDYVNVITLNVEYEHFSREGTLSRYMEFAARLADIVNPIYGCIHDLRDYGDSTGTVFIHKQVPGICWGNFFGAEYVNRVGRNELESFNGCLVANVAEQGIYIQLSENPIPPYGREVRAAQKRLRRVLGRAVARPQGLFSFLR